MTDAIGIAAALKPAWDVVEPHPAMTDIVRAALAFGSASSTHGRRGGARREDSRDDPRRYAPADHYPFAITAASHNVSAAQFLDFLKSPAAREILKAQGFGVIPP